MNNLQNKRKVHRGRLFPEIQWTEEKKALWKDEKEYIYNSCKPIFEKLKPELIKTHYNWYLAVEPESGDYFVDQDQILAAKIAHQKYPGAKIHVFRINQTGVCGTI